MSNKQTIACRNARRRFPAFDETTASPAPLAGDERAALAGHFQDCRKCAREYRIFALTRATLDAAATREAMIADDSYLRVLWARINRGLDQSQRRPGEESWAAALLITARQLIPAMAMLLLLIIGATYLWSTEVTQGTDHVALRPRDRVMFSDMYEYPAPTQDDVLETLVAAEEKENGK